MTETIDRPIPDTVPDGNGHTPDEDEVEPFAPQPPYTRGYQDAIRDIKRGSLVIDGAPLMTAGLDARPASPAASVSGLTAVAEIFHEWGIKAGYLQGKFCPPSQHASEMLWRVSKHLDVIEALEELEQGVQL